MASAMDSKASGNHDTVLLIARVLVGVLFLIGSYTKLVGMAGATAYFGRLGIPMPEILLPATMIFEALVGILLIIGYQTRLCALLIAIFVVIAALIAHRNFGDGNQLNHFLKNLAIAGGCLGIFVAGPGAMSVDSRRG
jgi:putative oxidoreductase